MKNINISILQLFVFCVFTANSLSINAAGQTDLDEAVLGGWLEGYEKAWEMRDADKAAALFTEDATYQDDPYKEPHKGRQAIRDYWAGVTADQDNIDFSYEILSINGNKGIVHWHSEFLQPSSGSTIILDGIFYLTFTSAGLCSDLKEWWHLKVIPPAE
ncbi:MAG: nuclear transport factor 2 family protein [Gammaproteobacteria bacterium]